MKTAFYEQFRRLRKLINMVFNGVYEQTVLRKPGFLAEKCSYFKEMAGFMSIFGNCQGHGMLIKTLMRRIYEHFREMQSKITPEKREAPPPKRAEELLGGVHMYVVLAMQTNSSFGTMYFLGISSKNCTRSQLLRFGTISIPI